MKNILIVYASIHKNNTKKIAEQMADVLQADLVSVQKLTKEDLLRADIIGFGSGIYFGKFHKGLINKIEELIEMEGKKAFVFSTSGMRKNFIINHSHKHLKGVLEKKGFEVVGDFNCLGHDENGPLKYIGGVNKGRPNEDDLAEARRFAEKVL